MLSTTLGRVVSLKTNGVNAPMSNSNFFPLTNDLMFKILFVKEPKLLISILNSVLFPEKEHQVREITILNPELSSSSPDEKRSYLDIRAKDENGKIFHVEVQVAHQSSFVKRSLYYLSKKLSQVKHIEYNEKLKRKLSEIRP